MKPRFMLLAFSCCLFLLTNVVLPQVNKPLEIDAKHQIVYKNPIKGLCSDDEDIRLDCAFVLGQLKYQKAAIPLMRMLREDPSEAVRIVAAQSLIKIGDPIGVYLVQRTSDFNDFSKVRNYCSKFYNAYAYEQYTAQHRNATDEEILAALAAQE